MKNKILIFLTIISSFILVDKVKAADIIYDYNSSNFSLLNENIDIVHEINSLSNTYNLRDRTYLISLRKSGNYYTLYFGIGNYYCDSLNYFPIYGDSFKTYNDGNYISYISIFNNNKVQCENYVKFDSLSRNGYISLSLNDLTEDTKKTFLDNVKILFENGAVPSYLEDSSRLSDVFSSGQNFNLDYFSSYQFFSLIYSNRNIKYIKNDDYTTVDYSINIDNSTYNYGDYIPTYYEYFDLDKPKTPEININIEISKVNDDNEPIQKKITVDYGIYDFDKYKYEYSSYGISDKNSSDGLFWLPYLNSTPFEFYVNNNDTYFFRVTDKNTGDYVTSSSITVSGIVENLPYIVFENLNDDECVLNYYNESYFTCDLVKLYAKNIDYSKYSLQYSYDNINWINHNNYYSSEIYIRDNTTLYARIIDLTTDDIVDTLSYTVTRLTFPNSNLPIIKITTDCVDNVVGSSIKVNLYNYDGDKYKLFYKLYDNTDFLETNVVVDGNNFYKYFTLSKETVLYIKIVDVDNNYVTGTSFTYTDNLCKNDNLDINNIDDINDLILDKESSSNQLFSQILNICYTSAPRRLVIFLKLFLILTLIGAVLYLVGWK